MLNRFPLLARALVSGLLTLGFFGVCEWALSQSSWSSLYVGDPGHDWRLRENLNLEQVPHIERGTQFSVQTSSEGFRDGSIPTEGPWVLALGCSTTFGWGVDAQAAWPELLEDALGVPVFNAGVPGHSTEQGKSVADQLIQYRPTLAILGWGLRDAQKTTIADVDRHPATFPRNTSVYAWLSQKLRTPSVNRGTIPRVSSGRFLQNLEAVISSAEAKGVKVLLLDMTGRSDTPSHGAVLKQTGRPMVVPQLSASLVFEEDPIHLNDAGNRALSQLLLPAVRALLQYESAAEPKEAEPSQTR